MPEESRPKPPQDAASSHDKLFKIVFTRFLDQLLELVEPRIAARLDLAKPRFLGGKLSADFRKHGHVEPDLVAEIMTRDHEPQPVLLHVEAERRFRHTVDRRMLRYDVHLVLITGRQVLSIVVFLRGGPPGIEIRELAETVAGFETLRVRYIAFGLSRCLAEDYVDRPQPLAAGLAALMRSERWDRVEQKIRCLSAIACADLDIQKRFILAKVVHTYLQLTEEEQARFQERLERTANKEARDMIVTWDEALAEREAQGIAIGQAKGVAIGEAKGEAKATQEAILRLARKRHAARNGFAEKIRAIDDIDRLNEIFDRILDADSLDDIDLS